MSGRPEATPGAEPGQLATRLVHDGRIVRLSVDTVRFPNGATGELEMIRHSGAAAVLPLVGSRTDPDPEILLIRQYRYAGGGYMYEVPAGRPDAPGEDWEVCARRELREETGMVPGRITHLMGIHTTPGFTDEFIHIFLAEELTEEATSFDPDEFIELVRIPFSDALAMVERGEVTDAKTICALLFARSFLPGR